MAFSDRRGMIDHPKMAKWIKLNIHRVVSRTKPDWIATQLKNRSPYKYLHSACRTAVAHATYKEGKQKIKILNPDDPLEYLRIKNDIPIIQGLADEIFKQELLK